MMKYLALALLLCALLTLSNASCTPKAITYILGETPMTHCKDEDDGTWHAVGSSWKNSKCLSCTCNGCCAMYSIPTWFPDDCVSVFDWQACRYKVHKKDDPTVQCPIYMSMSK